MDRWEEFNAIIDNEILDCKEKSMLLILFRFVQNGTNTAYPSRERIKKLYGSKKNDVIDKVLKSLEDKKLLIREKDSGKKTKYHLYIGTEIEPGIITEPGTQIEPSTIIEPGSQIEPTPGSQIEPTPGSQIEPQKEKKKKTEKKNIYSEIDMAEIRKNYQGKKDRAEAYKKLPNLIKQYGKDQLIRCISRYNNYVLAERNGGFKTLSYKNEKTFWNSGYMDYLDSVFEEENNFDMPDVYQNNPWNSIES